MNAVIDDDVPVRAFFPSAEELAALPLRRAPKVAGPVRVVVVGDFDVTPCGGTHCTGSAQVGFVRITGVERYKGKVRVTFSAGRRARAELWREAGVLRDLGRSFTAGPLDVPAGVDKLRRELTEAREALGRVRGRLADTLGAELAREAGATGRAVAVVDDAGPDLLRALATRITAQAGAVAFLAGRGPEASPSSWPGGAGRRSTAARSSRRPLRRPVGAAAAGRSAPRVGCRRRPTGRRW